MTRKELNAIVGWRGKVIVDRWFVTGVGGAALYKSDGDPEHRWCISVKAGNEPKPFLPRDAGTFDQSYPLEAYVPSAQEQP